MISISSVSAKERPNGATASDTRWLLLASVLVFNAAAQSATFVYVGNDSDNNVSGYLMNQSSGSLTPLPGSPFATGGATYLAFHPSDKFLYVVTAATSAIAAFAIDASTGLLTPVPGSPFVVGALSRIAIDPTGRFLYAFNSVSGNRIFGFTINSGTGALTPMSGSPFTMPGSASGAFGAFSLSGRFLYVASNVSGNISAFNVDSSTGALTPAAGSPFAAGSNPGWIGIHPSGKFLYVNDFGFGYGSSFGYTIDGTTGALTRIPGQVAQCGGPQGGAIDPNGQFIYIAGENTTGVLVCRIDLVTGALTLVPGSPFP